MSSRANKVGQEVARVKAIIKKVLDLHEEATFELPVNFFYAHEVSMQVLEAHEDDFGYQVCVMDGKQGPVARITKNVAR